MAVCAIRAPPYDHAPARNFPGGWKNLDSARAGPVAQSLAQRPWDGQRDASQLIAPQLIAP